MSLRRLFRRRRKTPFAEWGYHVRDFRLKSDGVVHYAQWRHPAERVQNITQEEVDGLRRVIRPGDFAIDVGAHTGDTTLPMALAAGRTGCVLALEPNPYVFKVLEANAALNPAATRIIPHCLAATAEDGVFVFHYGDASFCNGGYVPRLWRNPFRRRYPLPVAGRNLLRMLEEDFAAWLPKLAYIKVDAEGYDRQILESILPVLREYQPVVRTEVFKKLSAGQRRVLYDLLATSGYDVFHYVGGVQPKGSPITRDRMTAERHFDILAMPQHCPVRMAA
jgi:FkbM family methyltransferase